MKKIWNAIQNIVMWVVVIFTVCMMIFTIISVRTFDQNDRSLLGYQFFVVQTDSMSATDFEAGDLIVTKEVNPSELEEGDIIAFVSQNTGSYGETVTHKIRSRTTDSTGEPGFITYGTTTNTDDETMVTYPYIIGKYQGRLPGVGAFFLFLKTTPGYILCILIPFLIVILFQALQCIRLFRRYKREQMQELKAEKEQLEKEREENKKMVEELMLLKKQLEESGISQIATTVPDTDTNR